MIDKLSKPIIQNARLIRQNDTESNLLFDVLLKDERYNIFLETSLGQLLDMQDNQCICATFLHENGTTEIWKLPRNRYRLTYKENFIETLNIIVEEKEMEKIFRMV